MTIEATAAAWCGDERGQCGTRKDSQQSAAEPVGTLACSSRRRRATL